MKAPFLHALYEEPCLPEDPVLLDAMIKGGTGEKRKTGAILTVCLLVLSVLAAFVIYTYTMCLPEPVDFLKADDVMFHNLWGKSGGKGLRVERVDGYYLNGWYYFDVSFATGQDENTRRLIYFGQGEVQDYLDPEAAVKTTDELAQLSSFQTAQTLGEYRSYTAQELADLLLQ